MSEDIEVEVGGDILSFPAGTSPETMKKVANKHHTLSLEPISNEEALRSGFFKGGKDAIQTVEEKEGELTLPQKRVVELEGYVGVPYLDSKGNKSIGVGQTGEFIGKTFKDSFLEHENRAKRLIPSYEGLPAPVRAELVQAAYRGDLAGSPNFLKLFNNKKFEEAAEAFLNNKEYKDPSTPSQIKERMESVASAVRMLAEESSS